VLAKRVGGPANLTKLKALKAKYDPGNFFQQHQFRGLVS
jgi:hypothetical protein